MTGRRCVKNSLSEQRVVFFFEKLHSEYCMTYEQFVFFLQNARAYRDVLKRYMTVYIYFDVY